MRRDDAMAVRGYGCRVWMFDLQLQASHRGARDFGATGRALVQRSGSQQTREQPCQSRIRRGAFEERRARKSFPAPLARRTCTRMTIW